MEGFTISGNTLQLIVRRAVITFCKATQPSTVNTSNFGLVAPATDPGSTALTSLLGLSSGVTLVQPAQSSLIDAEIIQVRAALGATRQIFFCSQNGYDTHSNQLATQVTLFGNLANALAAFDQAMGTLTVQNNVTTFTESDFGRTFQPNGNAGTDHGRGSHALIMGGAVNGGNLYGTFSALTLAGPDDSGIRGTWVPGTSTDQYGGALAKWFGLAPADPDYVFPNLHAFNYQTPAFI